MKWLWPIVTGKTFFDSSTIIHLCAWIFIGSGCAYAGWPLWLGMLICMMVAIGWEFFEIHAELWWPDTWQHPESWHNRWVSDPLMCILGVALAYWLVRIQ